MLFLARVVPALFAASSLVQAASVPRTDGGKGDFFNGFIEALKQHNLTFLADSYQKVAETDAGKPVLNGLQQEITLLAPENCAFEPDYPKLGADTLLYNALQGNIDKGFRTSHTSHTRRDGLTQSHSLVPSQFGVSGGASSKRAEYATQPQGIDQVTSFSKKRWSNSVILVDQTVGNAIVVERFTFKHIIILIINKILTLPDKISKILCQPLIKDAPEGFGKFNKGLENAGLSDKVDSCDFVTVFAPLDDSIEDGDKLSKDLVGNHVVLGQSWYSPEFVPSLKTTSESGQKLELCFENNVHYVKCGKTKAVVLRVDVLAPNGVVHVIDRPLKCD